MSRSKLASLDLFQKLINKLTRKIDKQAAEIRELKKIASLSDLTKRIKSPTLNQYRFYDCDSFALITASGKCLDVLSVGHLSISGVTLDDAMNKFLDNNIHEVYSDNYIRYFREELKALHQNKDTAYLPLTTLPKFIPSSSPFIIPTVRILTPTKFKGIFLSHAKIIKPQPNIHTHRRDGHIITLDQYRKKK